MPVEIFVGGDYKVFLTYMIRVLGHLNATACIKWVSYKI